MNCQSCQSNFTLQTSFLHLCVYVFSHSVMSDTSGPHGRQPTRLLCPWNSPGKNRAVSCHALLQGLFPTQGSNPGLLHCRQILYQLSHQGSPRILVWVGCPFSRETSQSRNWTRVPCTAGRFFPGWAIWEALCTYEAELTQDSCISLFTSSTHTFTRL